MSEAEQTPGRPGERGASWEGVERAQLEAVLTATPVQRLAWLEEALRLAHASGALAAARQERDPRR